MVCWIAEEAQHGILFHELVDTDAKFVFVGAGLGLNGEGDGRLGKRNGRVLNGMSLVAKGIAGERLLEFGYGADVSGGELGNRDCCLPRTAEMWANFSTVPRT